MNVCLDQQRYTVKPTGAEIGKISSRIPKSVKQLTANNIKSFADDVGNRGQSFCPATFLSNTRKKENFMQTQMFVLDFDGGISPEAVLERAKKYNLPVLFAYDTFSSTARDRFRTVFYNDISIRDRRTAEVIQNALITVFPESDSTTKDLSKLYFGGKGLLHFNETLPEINLESVVRGMTFYLKDRYHDTHYKDKLTEFAKANGIKQNQNRLLDISVTEIATEDVGVNAIGNFLPNPIILHNDGEKFPNLYYGINWCDTNTNHTSVAKQESQKNEGRNNFRASMIGEISKTCELYREFENGERKLSHAELFGVATNIIHVEAGAKRFVETVRETPIYQNHLGYWDYNLSYFRQNRYKPYSCEMFCPYKDKCVHTRNILSTAKPKVLTIERVANYEDKFYPLEEVTADVSRAVKRALNAADNRVYVIKAQTAIGKTEIYLTLMQESAGRWLIAVPTNILKNDVLKRAKKMGLDVIETPSLDEIKDAIPGTVWRHIQKLYRSGQHASVYPYIESVLKTDDIPCLKKHIERLKAVEKFDGHVITTHRKLLNYDEKALKSFDEIIVDEDIIFKSVIPNQGEISIADLKKVAKITANSKLADKIKQLFRQIERIKQQSSAPLFTLPSFEADDNDAEDTSTSVDAPSFCLAKHFYFRQASVEKTLHEDSIVFFKPVKFSSTKIIVVSATADEDIYENYFGKNRVDFYECKRAKYVGKLNQYYDKSMSRACIDENAGIIGKIRKWTGNNVLITFMKYALGELHFGNTEGCNHLAGTDIDVVGTPYQAEFLYKLFAYSLGLNFDQGAKVKPNLPVVHNGYKFRFTTYEDEELQKIMLWMIETELEQAVGRARLLRFDCTVNLFSNFPLWQSRLMKSEYDDHADDDGTVEVERKEPV